MKKKAIKDEFEMECWYRSIVTDPYQVLAESFFHAEMCHFRNMIKKMLEYAEADKLYKDESPSDVLLNMKIIRSVIKAAHHLKEIKKGPIEISERDVFNKNYYCSNLLCSTEWADFPRFLSIKEFCNPYKVFRKFFHYQPLEKWVQDWEEAVDCALSECRGGMEINMITTYTHLAKLVEAAHLINVRVIN